MLSVCSTVCSISSLHNPVCVNRCRGFSFAARAVAQELKSGIEATLKLVGAGEQFRISSEESCLADLQFLFSDHLVIQAESEFAVQVYIGALDSGIFSSFIAVIFFFKFSILIARFTNPYSR